MLGRRGGEFPSHKAEEAGFAAKATDLEALRTAVVDAAGVGYGLWFSYLFALLYFAIAAGAVTHRDLLLESPVKLPFLNVELPLNAFFVLGPLVFLVVHAYVMLHFLLLAGKVGAFHAELRKQISEDDKRAQLRRQLPSNIFVQFLAGPREVREGIVGFLLRSVAWISLVAGPIALLVLFQLQFLPYHNPWITWWQRIAVLIDLVLLSMLWPPIVRSKTALLTWTDLGRVNAAAWLLASLLPLLLVFTIATFPGEWLEQELYRVGSRVGEPVQTRWWGWPHKLLVAGTVDYVTGKPESLWSNVLVLPNFDIGDRLKFDPEGKFARSPEAVSLRGRRLEGAVFVYAHLLKADFTGAELARANFTAADLREAKFECAEVGTDKKCAQLRGASLDEAQLQGARLDGAQLQGARLNDAQLQGASLLSAQLRGAELANAQLQGAWLVGAQLSGAWLNDAQLQGASLDGVELQGAWLDHAQLPGASLVDVQLQGAILDHAQLQGASLLRTQLQGASLDDAQLQGASLEYAQLQGASLDGVQLQAASFDHAQLETASLSDIFVWRTKPPEREYLEGALIEMPRPEPKYTQPTPGYTRTGCMEWLCNWDDASYMALKARIQTMLQGPVLDAALKRIEPLGKQPYEEDAASAREWRELGAESQRSAETYPAKLTKALIRIGCDASGAPYVIGRLLQQHRLYDTAQEAEIARAFLDEANCPGAKGLSAENEAKLREMRGPESPRPSPGRASRRR